MTFNKAIKKTGYAYRPDMGVGIAVGTSGRFFVWNKEMGEFLPHTYLDFVSDWQYKKTDWEPFITKATK